ncbi:hypothetical protein EV1_043787 [Malus domestica]
MRDRGQEGFFFFVAKCEQYGNPSRNQEQFRPFTVGEQCALSQDEQCHSASKSILHNGDETGPLFHFIFYYIHGRRPGNGGA